jgi:glucose/arabinose dehydrogenase
MGGGSRANGASRGAVLIAALILGVAACSRGPASAAPVGRTMAIPGSGAALAVVAGGLQDPLEAQSPPGDPRLFIVEQAGRIRVLEDGHLLPAPFLDLTRQVSYGGERGLLGLAFSPAYARDGFFYVNYTNKHGDTHVERYHVSRDPDVADPASRTLVLEVDQPYANHNGGCLRFGPDGMLYIGMGDGGSGGDPHGNGQNRQALLGKLLRLDVDHGQPYSIPADNPYAHGGGRGEIWAIGMRNPWRFAFDPPAGLLVIADVGQNKWEEIDVVDSKRAGLDYGWNRYEGTHCYLTPCDPAGVTQPVIEYSHSDGCSVIGGYVYRGHAITGWSARYLYVDYCRDWLRSCRFENGGAVDAKEWRLPHMGAVLSFGQDSRGELYLCCNDGNVYRFVPAAPGS